MHSNSHAGQDFIEGMSVIQIEPGRCLAAHKLDEISSRHVSHSNEVQKCLAAHKLDEISSRHVSNSNEVQKLTCWMGFYGGMSNRA